MGTWRVTFCPLTPDPSHPFTVRVLVHCCIGGRETLYFCPIGRDREDGIHKLRRLVGGSRTISPATRAEILTALDAVNTVSVPQG